MKLWDSPSFAGNPVSVFETNIRVLGGLLSAYDLSKDWGQLDPARPKMGTRVFVSLGYHGLKNCETELNLTDRNDKAEELGFPECQKRPFGESRQC